RLLHPRRRRRPGARQRRLLHLHRLLQARRIKPPRPAGGLQRQQRVLLRALRPRPPGPPGSAQRRLALVLGLPRRRRRRGALLGPVGAQGRHGRVQRRARAAGPAPAALLPRPGRDAAARARAEPAPVRAPLRLGPQQPVHHRQQPRCRRRLLAHGQPEPHRRLPHRQRAAGYDGRQGSPGLVLPGGVVEPRGGRQRLAFEQDLGRRGQTFGEYVAGGLVESGGEQVRQDEAGEFGEEKEGEAV
ncbi:hypothetical protein LTR39_005106, partial [Cryomyces antarcticus]